ncbi:hypothetical protein C7E12_17960 [Stenotrophomonas maltophilia]|nr:hypothetical protein C7E12_17960 [Stenotrophomonas maltophilia]
MTGAATGERIIGASLVQANAQLLADMLVELPTLATSSCMRAWTSWPMRITSCRRSGPKGKASSCRC